MWVHYFRKLSAHTWSLTWHIGNGGSRNLLGCSLRSRRLEIGCGCSYKFIAISTLWTSTPPVPWDATCEWIAQLVLHRVVVCMDHFNELHRFHYNRYLYLYYLFIIIITNTQRNPRHSALKELSTDVTLRTLRHAHNRSITKTESEAQNSHMSGPARSYTPCPGQRKLR
jgi:hypothetical protein